MAPKTTILLFLAKVNEPYVYTTVVCTPSMYVHMLRNRTKSFLFVQGRYKNMGCHVSKRVIQNPTGFWPNINTFKENYCIFQIQSQMILDTEN